MGLAAFMRGIRQHGIERSLYEECMDGMDALTASGHEPASGRLLAFFPFVHRNPFQTMLYARAFDHGFACFPFKAVDDVTTLPDDVKLVLHYHWLHRIFDQADSAREAKKVATRFGDRLQRQKEAGHQIVWTVHNVLSHAAAFPDEELALREVVANIANVIHVMNPRTADLCKPSYQLDESKIISVPHSSYKDVYGDYVCARQARFELGLKPEDTAFLLFGSLGQRKGTRQFLGEIDRLQGTLKGRATVVVAGSPGDAAFMDELQMLVAGRSDVKLFPKHIDDQAVQIFFKASDVVVCPYPQGLNSGVMATAATFARPVVVPDMMADACPGLEAAVFSFAAGDMTSCVDACFRAVDGKEADGCKGTLQSWASEYDPRRVSDNFFMSLRNKLEQLS